MNPDAAAKVAHAVERQLATFREDLNREFLRELRTELRTQLRAELMAELGEKIKDMGGPSAAPDARALRDTAKAVHSLAESATATGQALSALLARVADLEAVVAALGKAGASGLTARHLDAIVTEIGAYVRRCIRECGPPRYVGVHAVGREYSKGELVTHSGSLWHCNRTTLDHPGGGSEAWTLAVKSGQHRN